MSFSKTFEPLLSSNRICINDKFFGDEGAVELAALLSNHPRVQSLQLKSNSISPQGFVHLFRSLPIDSLRSLNIEHNNLGANNYVQWHEPLADLISTCSKLQRLNLSNNRIDSEGFSRLVYAIAYARNLKLLELRYNDIGNEQIEQLVKQLRNNESSALLFVELSGNTRVRRETLEQLEAILAKNRKRNPITKQKIVNGISNKQNINEDQSYANRTLLRSHTVDNIPQEGMFKYLQDMLDQSRAEAAELKVRLEAELAELQKREKVDAQDLNQIENKCAEMMIVNRNLKFELDRTLSQLSTLQKDQQSHLRLHEEKIHESTTHLHSLEAQYSETETRMAKEHEFRMKEVMRDWEARLRSVEEKIRLVEGDNSLLETEIKKNLEKKQRLRVQCMEEENMSRGRVQEEQLARFNLEMKDMESKLRELEGGRDSYLRRNQGLAYQLQKSDADNKRQIAELQAEVADLRMKENDFSAKSKDFFSKNEKIKADIQMKQISIEKLQDQIARLEREIEQKRESELNQIGKIRQSFQYTRMTKNEDRNVRADKLRQLQNQLREAQLEGAKLRQQYGLLAQKLQVNISLAVHQVFKDNSLY